LLRYESGAAAALSGVQVRTLGEEGLLSVDDVHAAIPTKDHHNAPVSLLAIENTHNASGGRVFPHVDLRRVVAAAREHGLATHLDGARIFNAEAATGIPASEWAEPFDTVSFCLSKGLGAPVGSLVCGSAAVIDRIHRIRKMLGGGMRQAGILAAAGLYALEHNIERLAQDHQHARRLAEGLAARGIALVRPPETNIVLLAIPDAPRFIERARARGVLVGDMTADRVRAVTHLDVSEEDIEEAIGRLAELC
jgi:threonine aldolase